MERYSFVFVSPMSEPQGVVEVGSRGIPQRLWGLCGLIGTQHLQSGLVDTSCIVNALPTCFFRGRGGTEGLNHGTLLFSLSGRVPSRPVHNPHIVWSCDAKFALWDLSMLADVIHGLGGKYTR